MIGRAITALRQGATPLNYYPLYGGPHRISLQEVLFGSDLDYPVSSLIKGYWVDETLTLEEFLINVSYPSWIEKKVTISYAQNEPITLSVRELFAKEDNLYMRALRIESCHTPLPLTFREGLGLEAIPVALINYLELEGGERWRITF
jgi:hypothetical protein